MAEKLQNIHGTTTIMVVDNHKLPHFLGNLELLSHVKDNNYFFTVFETFFRESVFLTQKVII